MLVFSYKVTGVTTMTITLKVPSIACEGCANTITKAINNQQPAAQISVDVANKIVTVETTASLAEIAQWISEVGHIVESSSEG
ncbi:heavy metal transporter [Microcystis aeruginosa NIES-298]|jgi:copper chaperone|nr:heavy-metal-associated domain-containing protein [Microcystis aeruginosa]NCQ91488.1 heavy-metal-associated domain-containing protein [Microcystis aeruginosa LG13-13]NCR04701.1 heavy-metal-associated domain-containing protein [Microcystis aeruginosa LG13-03]NCR62930.1 heavy-metal-associated domain-containing protein [Microcystis aeruginosa LG11-05]QHU84396.1 heavy metal transporter [Microcystis aeruginosa NIES-298]GBE99991.1 Copper chaperone [Microcystis aeruginosa NIES-298]